MTPQSPDEKLTPNRYFVLNFSYKMWKLSGRQYNKIVTDGYAEDTDDIQKFNFLTVRAKNYTKRISKV